MPPGPERWSSSSNSRRMTQAVEDATVGVMPDAPTFRLALQPMTLPRLVGEPLVSVIVSNYNYGRFVGDALRSVLDQGYGRMEVVVCDDGSTDDSCSVIEAIAAQDDRVSLIRKPNAGQASAFNAAFSASRGQVVGFLDADDLWLGDKVEKSVHALQETNRGLLIHQMVVVDSEMNELQRIPTFTRFESGWIGDRVLERGGRWRWMPASAMVMRKEVLGRVLPMPEAPFKTDADTFILMLAPLLTEIESVEEVLGLYRLHGSNAFSGTRFDRRAAARTIEALSGGITEANKRLASIGMGHVQLDISKNIKIAEQIYLRDSFDGLPRRQLFRQYVDLIGRLWKDDLYSRIQRAWATVLFGMIIPMPRRMRPSWASMNLGASKVREAVRKLQRFGLAVRKSR
jgi:glycosyltransferase involved in cell wall biosynthesis